MVFFYIVVTIVNGIVVVTASTDDDGIVDIGAGAVSNIVSMHTVRMYSLTICIHTKTMPFSVVRIAN